MLTVLLVSLPTFVSVDGIYLLIFLSYLAIPFSVQRVNLGNITSGIFSVTQRITFGSIPNEIVQQQSEQRSAHYRMEPVLQHSEQLSTRYRTESVLRLSRQLPVLVLVRRANLT